MGPGRLRIYTGIEIGFLRKERLGCNFRDPRDLRMKLFTLLAGWLLAALPLMAAPYQVGQVVDDFTLHARRAFTNDQGQVIAAGDPVRLSDFQGKIVFFEFFFVW